jgi:hypothetical protein
LISNCGFSRLREKANQKKKPPGSFPETIGSLRGC